MQPFFLVYPTGRLTIGSLNLEFPSKNGRLPDAPGMLSNDGDVERLTRIRRSLPDYYSLIGDRMIASAIRFWFDLGTYLLEDNVLGTLIFCNTDGSKSLLMKLADGSGVVVSLFRSACPDERYIESLSIANNTDQTELRDAFNSLPKFDPNEVEKVITEASNSTRLAVNACEQARSLAQKYSSISTSRINRYKFDIRVFALIHKLRTFMTPMHVHVLVKDDEEENDSFARLYIYNTLEALPLRPPIYACITTDSIQKAFESRSEGEIEATNKSIIAVALNRPRLDFVPEESSKTFYFECPRRKGISAIFEIRGPNLDGSQFDMIRSAVEAALDPSGERLVTSLRNRSRLSSKRQISEFQSLLRLYLRSITPAVDSEEKGYCTVQRAGTGSWAKAVTRLDKWIMQISPGTLTSKNVDLLEHTVSLLRSEKPDFDLISFEHSMEELAASVLSDRFGMFLTPSEGGNKSSLIEK